MARQSPGSKSPGSKSPGSKSLSGKSPGSESPGRRAAALPARLWRATSVWQGAAHTLGRGVAELVFPAECVQCRGSISAAESDEPAVPVCGDCLEQLQWFVGPACGRCGAPTPATARPARRCPLCRGRKLWFDEAIAGGEYGGLLREMLLRMKRTEGDRVSLALGRLLWQKCGEKLQAARADVVVPVAMHWRRRIAHGTNSPALLAEILSAKLRLPLAERLLCRRRNTSPQFSLSPSERWPNVRRAFVVRPSYHLKGARVLLVDDILTTGATCSESARALKSAGAARVIAVVAARALSV